jgi:hypothetical protein
VLICCADLLVKFSHHLPTRAIEWQVFSMLIVREAIGFSGRPFKALGQKKGGKSTGLIQVHSINNERESVRLMMSFAYLLTSALSPQ